MAAGVNRLVTGWNVSHPVAGGIAAHQPMFL